MHELILVQGIQGSGKTTYAKKWVEQFPTERVRFNNDDIRNMLGPYWVLSRETMVADLKRKFLSSAILHNYDIIIDNMNLSKQEIDYYKNVLINYPDYELKFVKMDTPLEECIKRDAKRPNPIGEEIIRKTYNKYFG